MIQVVNFHDVQARCYHGAAACSLSSKVTEVVMFGGCPEWPTNYTEDADISHIASTTVLRFGECMCMSAVVRNVLSMHRSGHSKTPAASS